MQLGEFFIALGFDVDDKKLKGFHENIKDLGKDFLKISAVAAGTVYAINKFVAGGVEAATTLRNFNAETGNSIEALQKWQVGSVLTNAAASADQVTASFQSMASSIADVTMGKGNAGAYAMLGISDVRGMDVGDAMEELRANFDANVAQWGLPQTVNLMRDVGFDPAMLQALKLTRKEFNKLVDSKFLDAESREKLIKLGDAISKAKLDFKLFKDQLSADIAPKLIEYLETAMPIIEDFQESIAAAHDAFTNWTSGLTETQLGALKAFAAMLFIAFFPVTSMFVALAAAIWDVGRALRGLPSFTGDGLAWISDLAEINEGSYADKIAQAAGNLVQGAKDMLSSQEYTEGGVLNKSPAIPFAPADFIESDLMRYYQGNLSPANNNNDSRIERIIRETQNNMNNVWNIESTADPMMLSDLIMMKQKQMLDNTLSEKNNGSRY
jgi:hypothetical protein